MPDIEPEAVALLAAQAAYTWVDVLHKCLDKAELTMGRSFADLRLEQEDRVALADYIERVINASKTPIASVSDAHDRATKARANWIRRRDMRAATEAVLEWLQTLETDYPGATKTPLEPERLFCMWFFVLREGVTAKPNLPLSFGEAFGWSEATIRVFLNW